MVNDMMESKRTSLIIFAVVAVLAVAAALYTPQLMNWNNEKNIEYGDVSIEDTIELIEQNPELVILDVRTVSEFEEGHIKEAINIPVDELVDRLDELSKDDELLVYCRTGNRSGAAVRILFNADYTKIYHMHEGISVWIHQGRPVV